MTTAQNLQNSLNQNNPHGLSRAVANQKIMRILSEIVAAITSSESPSGSGLDEATMINIGINVQDAQTGGDNTAALPTVIPIGKYLLVGQIILRGTTLAILSPGGVIIQLESDGGAVVTDPIGGSVVQIAADIDGVFSCWSISGSIIDITAPMTTARLIVTFPFTGALDVLLDGRLIPVTPAV